MLFSFKRRVGLSSPNGRKFRRVALEIGTYIEFIVFRALSRSFPSIFHGMRLHCRVFRRVSIGNDGDERSAAAAEGADSWRESGAAAAAAASEDSGSGADRVDGGCGVAAEASCRCATTHSAMPESILVAESCSWVSEEAIREWGGGGV